MKKFLSLVLALIMTMSLVTISAGATEYRDLTDKDEIQYEEAVAVLNRIGVITGYEDGSFRPETELTRGAAAKIIVSLMIGPDAAAALPNNASPYPDVPAGHTFAGVIGYCKTAGYISGYGDGTFKPANPLTGYAFAKMLLGAIGYKSNIEGFVDTGWTMNVARIGNVAGLFDRISFDGAKAVTRDEACQLALNTLKATMVDYGSANTVVSSSGEVLTVQGSKAVYVTSNNRDINANINRRVISATNNELTLEFGEEHFKDLRLEHDRYDPAYDVYGHPSNEWSYKKVTIGTFKLPADFTFTKQMAHIEDTAATKEKALGLRGYDTYSTDHRGGYVNWSTAASSQYAASPFADATQIHINGWEARVRNDDLYKQTAVPSTEKDKKGVWYSYDARSIGAATKELAPSLSEICDLTDNGVTVEVYVCPVDADFITDVVVMRTQLMEVDRVASDFVELDTIGSDSNDPRKNGKLEDIAGYNDFSLFEGVVKVTDNNYDPYNVLKDLKAGDEVAVIPYTSDDGKTWEVGEAYVPETVSGALTNVDIYNTRSKADGNAIAITVGGTTYPIAQWNKDMREIDATKIRSTKKDVTLLLDKMGNALLAKDVGASNNWIVVGDYYQATLTNGRVGWFVHGWTIKGDEVDLELGSIRGEAEKYAPGELVKYTVADYGDGEYMLTKPMYSEDAGYTNGRRILKNGDISSWKEPQGGEVTYKDTKYQSGEGIYNVSQFANKNGDAEKYKIESRNTLLPLEFYNTEVPVAEKALDAIGTTGHPVVRFNYEKATATPERPVGPTGDTAPSASITYCGELDGTGDSWYENNGYTNKWTYRSAPYDGVKFIYVGFDPTNGNVEVINVVDGVQNVSYDELKQINRTWKNVGTNDGNWVASPAEAYVDKDGKVKAVVIKSDSAEANLKDLMIITDNKGGHTYTKPAIGAEAPTSGKYDTYQYVSGEDGFKEEKTGYFDKALDVGTVVTGTLQSNGIIRAKVFHANAYTNRNPDGIYVKGIMPLRTQEQVKIKDAFYIGKGDKHEVQYLGTGVRGGGTLTASADILTDLDVMGYDYGFLEKDGYKNLIKVNSATQFLDLRDGRPGNITELSDLFDGDKCDADNAELKILVNGNKDSDGFRTAYVIMILTAKPEADNADAADVTIRARVDGKGKVSTGEGTEKDPWVFEIAPNTDYELEARINVTGTAQNMKWTNLDTKKVVSNDETLQEMTGAAGTEQKFSFYVENYDATAKDQIRTPKTVYVTVVSKETAEAVSGKLVEAIDDAEDLIKVGKFNVDITTTGQVNWNANITLPKYVDKVTDANKIKFDYKVLKNGVQVATASNVAASSVAGGTAVFNVAGMGSANTFIAGDSITVQITKVTFGEVNIQYWDADNKKDITNEVTASTYDVTTANSKVVSTTADANLKITIATADVTNTGVLSAKATTNAAAEKTQALGTADGTKGLYNNTTLDVHGDGKGALRIEISGISKLKNLVSLKLESPALDTGVDLNDFGVTATTSEKLTLTVVPASGEAGKDTFTLRGQLGAASDFVKYYVTVDGYCKDVEMQGTNITTLWSGTLSESATIKKSMVHVKVVQAFAAVSAEQTDKNTLVVTFTEEPDSSLTASVKTGVGLGLGNVTVAGNKATIVLSGTLTQNDIIVLNGHQKGDSTNTITAAASGVKADGTVTDGVAATWQIVNPG